MIEWTEWVASNRIGRERGAGGKQLSISLFFPVSFKVTSRSSVLVHYRNGNFESSRSNARTFLVVVPFPSPVARKCCFPSIHHS